MQHDHTALELARLTETPGARLRSVEPAQWSEAERCVAATTALIALLDDVRFEDDEMAVVERLAAVSDEDCLQYDAALRLLDVPRQHYLLRLVWRALFEGIDTEPGDSRLLQLIERQQRHGRALVRLLFWSGDLTEILQRRLGLYLDAHRDAVPGWPHRSHRSMPSPSEIPPSTIRSFKRDGPDGGDKFLFVFRQPEAETLIDAWLRDQPAAEFLRGSTRQTVTRLADARNCERGWFHGMPGDAVLGRAKAGHAPRLRGRCSLRGLQLDDTLSMLAEDFDWVILPWPHTMHESPLAWLSNDESLANAFDSLMSRHAQSCLLISRYRRFQSLLSLASGAQFGERDGYGEAALVAARHEPWQPWLVAEIGDYSRHGWRRWTRRLEAGAVATSPARDSILAAYRVTDIDAYYTLWQGLDSDEGIVRATVCGRDDAAQILRSFGAARFSSGFHAAQYLSQRHGWVYQHIHGGGSSEHHAMFHAQDVLVTQRVVEFAASKHLWYLSGHW